VAGLEDLADPAFLKTIWKKRVRAGLRTIRLGEFELDHDPLECLAFDWELDKVASDLALSIRNGTYRAQSGTAVRGAKSIGLTRPLASLDPRDLLVYIALVQLVENDLLAHSKPWVRFGRSQTSKPETDTSAESGWFRMWLTRQGQIWVITSSHEWIVESDIANFFASLSIDRVCEHVLNDSRGDAELVGLMRHMLGAFVPMSRYQRSAAGGLPQENFDGSRVIAHTMLGPLDEEFKAEGDADRYSRWVDDIVIGADTWPEALRQVQRVQQALEKLGLYPNSSKTKIVPRATFEFEHYKDENDYLGEVSSEVEKTGAPVDRPKYDAFVRNHIREVPRRRAWERVLRRIYTTSRNIGDDRLLQHAHGHLRDNPGSSAQILEYLASFRLTVNRFQQLVEVLRDLGDVYDDIDVRAREYLLLAPNVDSTTLRNSVATWALASARDNRDRRAAVAASSVLVAAKFGYSSHVDELAAIYEQLGTDSHLRRQLSVILFSLGRRTLDELAATAYASLPTSAQDFRFLRSVDRGESKAVRMCLGIIQPVDRQMPARKLVRTRGLVLAPLVARSSPSDFASVRATWLADLGSNPQRLRDAAAIRWIDQAHADPTTP
jgi:hypothetical protein